MTLRRVFHRDGVVQQHCRAENAAVAAFQLADSAAVLPDSVQVRDVMRTVVRLEGQRQQRLRQRLVGEKGCNSSCVSEGKDTFSSCWGNRSISIAAPDAGRMTVKRLLFTKVQPTIVITAVLQRNKQPRIAAFRRLRLVRACVRGDGRNTLISHWRRDMPTPLEIVRATYEGSSEENGRNLLAALAPMPSGPKPPVSPTPVPISARKISSRMCISAWAANGKATAPMSTTFTTPVTM